MFPHEAHILGSPQMNQQEKFLRKFSGHMSAKCAQNYRCIFWWGKTQSWHRKQSTSDHIFSRSFKRYSVRGLNWVKGFVSLKKWNCWSDRFVTLPDFRKLCDAVSRPTSLPGNFVPVHSTKHWVSLIERKHFNYYRKDICKEECELWMPCFNGL